MPNRPHRPAYTRCPKCGHHPLPADQALPAACPAGGVILAKVGQVVHRAPDADPDLQDAEPGWTTLLTHIPDRVDAMRFWLRVAILAALAIWAWALIRLDYRSGEMGGIFHSPPAAGVSRGGTRHLHAAG